MAAGGRVELLQKIGHCALARAALADDAHPLAAFDFKRQVGEHAAARLAVAERHMIVAHGAIEHERFVLARR